MTTIDQLMTRNPVCLNEEDDVGRVLEVLVDGDFRHVPVVDDGRLVGIVSQTDVLGWLGSTFSELRVGSQATAARAATAFLGSVMVRDPVFVAPETRVADAARLMLAHRIGSVPVVGGGQVVGIVTATDLLQHALRLELTEEQSVPVAPVRPRVDST